MSSLSHSSSPSLLSFSSSPPTLLLPPPSFASSSFHPLLLLPPYFLLLLLLLYTPLSSLPPPPSSHPYLQLLFWIIKRKESDSEWNMEGRSFWAMKWELGKVYKHSESPGSFEMIGLCL